MTEADKDRRFSITIEAPSAVICPVCLVSYGTMDCQFYGSQLLCWRCADQAHYLEALSIGMHKAQIETRYEHVRALVLRIEAFRRVIRDVHDGMSRAASYADIPL